MRIRALVIGLLAIIVMGTGAASTTGCFSACWDKDPDCERSGGHFEGCECVGWGSRYAGYPYPTATPSGDMDSGGRFSSDAGSRTTRTTAATPTAATSTAARPTAARPPTPDERL